jgi:multidrug efflux system membrane fusion protein
MRSVLSGFAAAFVTAGLLSACGGEVAPAPGVRPVLVVRPGAAVEAQASYAGEIRAREEAALSFRVDGKLVERRVDVGDRVRAGQVLAVLDAGDLQAQVRAAEAQLAAAQAESERARADQARFAALGEDRLVSRSSIDAQNAAATAARGQVDAARAALDVARNQRGYTQLRAPDDGVIAMRNVEAGQIVAAGQPVFTLAADGTREVVFAVGEGAVDSIRPGEPVEVELWSQSGKRWPGRVREVAPVADPASHTFAVRASLDASEDTFDLGQSARVHFESDAGESKRLAVPLSAVQRAGDSTAVFVVDRKTSTLRLQPVQLGPFGEERVPVLRGLAGDEWVVAAGGHLLQAGHKVRPVDRDNRPVASTAR